MIERREPVFGQRRQRLVVDRAAVGGRGRGSPAALAAALAELGLRLADIGAALERLEAVRDVAKHRVVVVVVVRARVVERGEAFSERGGLVGEPGDEAVAVGRRGGLVGVARHRRDLDGDRVGPGLRRDLGRLEVLDRGRGHLAPGLELQGRAAVAEAHVGEITVDRRREQTLEEQGRDGLERLEVVLAGVVDDLDDRPAPVEATQDLDELRREQVVGQLGDRGPVDGEDLVEGGELLEQSTPLVDPAHALHEQALGRLLDDRVAVDVLELDGEAAVGETEEAIDRLLGLQPAHLGVDDRAVPKPDRGVAEVGLEVDRAALARDLDGLKQVDDRHVGEVTRELGPRRVLALELLSLLALHQHAQAGGHLFNVDGLDEVVLDAELEPPDLVFDRLRGGQKDEGDAGPLGVLLDLGAEREPVFAGQAGVRDDQVGLAVLEHEQRLVDVLGGGHREPGLAQADLKHPATAGVAIDKE
ncbi:hypothetical protein ENSA5_02040 [Enhygromyxa salina]|uniref:Uncharacterized protein n=1 Tax=Enhygromyxa salina TaxID=215803 RepID=A0A2S9YKM2_9BACT|nr:hypothetical protein ENSA5_02040 [Enhygromyxa salina]